MAASIEIDQALTGSHVQQTFDASGTYVPDGGDPTITCVLKKTNGTVHATGATPVLSSANGTWTSSFSGVSPSTALKLIAEITDGTADSEEQPDITVDDGAPLTIGVLPPPPPPGLPGARTKYTVTGTHNNAIKHIFCAAVLYKAGNNSKKIEKIDAVAIAETDTPAVGKWTADLMVEPVPANQKLGVLVIGLTDKGKILGKGFRRRK